MAERGVALVASCLVHIGLVAATCALAPAISVRSLPVVLEAHLVTEEAIAPPRLIEAPRPKPAALQPVAGPRPLPAPPPPATMPVEVESAPEPAISGPPPPSPAVLASAPATPAAGPTLPAVAGTPGDSSPPASTSSPRLRDAPAAGTPSSSTATALAPRGDDLTQIAIPRGGYQVRPSYPAAARRIGAQGTTLLRVFVNTQGRVADVLVQQSAGHPELDHAAADAVRRWRFEPARRGAEAVAMWVLLPVEFRLR